MKRQPSTLAIASLFVCAALLSCCVNSLLGQNPQHELHENITAEQKSAVLEALRLHGTSGFYITPDIPPTKLLNAKQSCAVAAEDKLFALVDATTVEGPKNCLPITTRGIHIRNGWSGDSPGRHFLPYSGFLTGVPRSTTTHEVVVSGIGRSMAGSSMSQGALVGLLYHVHGVLRTTARAKMVAFGTGGSASGSVVSSEGAPATSGSTAGTNKLQSLGKVPLNILSTAISRDGRHVAYCTGTLSGPAVAVFVDGKTGARYDEVFELLFSSNGARLAHFARKGAKYFAVVDGAPAGPAYDAVFDETLTFSPLGDRLAYSARRARKKCVVSDGQEGSPYDALQGPVFSPDGKRMAYCGKKGSKAFVVIDGREDIALDMVFRKTIVFSPDSQRVAYVGQSKSNHFVMVDGQAGPVYDIIRNGCLRFSPDSKRVAYAASLGSKWRAVVDGQAGPEHEEIRVGSLMFSPDSKRVAYVARLGSKWMAVVDGQAGPEHEEIRVGSLVFSPDSKRLVYVARAGSKWLITANGQTGPGYDDIVGDSPVFSPTGNQLVYGAINELKVFAVADGQAGPEYDLSGSQASAVVMTRDGRHLAYPVKKNKFVYVVVDGQPGPAFDSIVGFPPGRLTFDPDGTLVYLATKENVLQRVLHAP